MKKIIFLMDMLAVMLLLLIMPAVAIAEGNLPTEPFTWEYLVTILGATAATLVIVQVFKFPLDKVWKIPTRFVVYFVALVIMETATYFTAGLDVSSALLNILNAFIVALAAYGSYELTFRAADEKKKAQAEENK